MKRTTYMGLLLLLLIAGFVSYSTIYNTQQWQDITRYYQTISTNITARVNLWQENYSHSKNESVQLLAMLRNQEYKELTAILEQKQQEYEQGVGADVDVSTAFSAFSTNAPEDSQYLDEWIAAFPNSFSPYHARGEYYESIGWKWRGGAFSNKTVQWRFNKMRDFHAKASVDYEQALQINPKLVTIYSNLISLSKAGYGDKVEREYLRKGLAIDPASYVVRKSYLFNLMPRWGGSYQQIDAFIEDTSHYVGSNPKLKPLLGFRYYIEAFNADKKQQYQKAITLMDKALEKGDKNWFYKRRADAYYKIEDYDSAMQDYNKAIEMWPSSVSALIGRARTYKRLKQMDKVLPDLNLAIKLAPYNRVALWDRGALLEKEEKYDAALADYTAALYYHEDVAGLWFDRGRIILRQFKDNHRAIEFLAKAAELEPDNPWYLYEYAVALNPLMDCKIYPVLRDYQKSCINSDKSICKAIYTDWADSFILKIEKDNYCPVEVKEYSFIYIDEQINTAFPNTIGKLTCSDLNIEEGEYSFKCKSDDISAEVIIMDNSEAVGLGVSTNVTNKFEEFIAESEQWPEDVREAISKVGQGKKVIGSDSQQHDFLWVHYRFGKELTTYHVEIFFTGLGKKMLRVDVSYFRKDNKNYSEQLQLFMEQLNQHLGSLD